MEEEQDTIIESETINEEQNSLSFTEHLHANLKDMTDAQIIIALLLELNFIGEFEPYRQDYLHELELVMEIYRETGNKDFIHLLF